MRTKGSNQNRFMRIITIPIRVLSKAKDFYVRSMTECAERVSYGNIMGGPGGQLSSLPKSFSVSSSRSDDAEDQRELIRAASTRSTGNSVGLNLYMQQQQMKQSPAVGSTVVPRSCSVGMGRIDEDRPCDFGEDNANVKAELLYPRSRSYAVTKRSVVF